MVLRRRVLLAAAAAVAYVGLVAGECPNACSGHGACGAYDMCTCYTGYVANDCSERTCPFAMAHVDSPIGDLDASGDVGSTTLAAGTQYSPNSAELFPLMENTAGIKTRNSAHYYAECANKGICDRVSGTCACFTGYEGSACQRSKCPNDCSGNGICLTNRELAKLDYDNVYELWDADIQQGCYCDPGFTGYDCSQRECPYGMDPLYLDDVNTARVSTWTAIFTASSSQMADATGTWRLKFYDVFGEDWVTEPITLDQAQNDTSTEMKVEAALEALPYDVVSSVDVTSSIDDSGTDGTLTIEMTFTTNPGALRVPEIIITDEAGRDTTFDSAGTSPLTATLTDRGIVGENYDNFGQNCNVEVKVELYGAGELSYGKVAYMRPTSGTLKTLKSCLGDSNNDASDNVDIEDWDYGSEVPGTDYVIGRYPHLVKLVSANATAETDGGVFAVAWYDGSQSTPTKIELATAVFPGHYYVFATDGVLERVWYDLATVGAFAMDADDMGLGRFDQYSDTIYTSLDFSCENAAADSTTAGVNAYTGCLEKGDYLVVPSSQWGNVSSTGTVITGGQADPYDLSWQENLNTAGLYEIKKISSFEYYPSSNSSIVEDRYQIVVDRPIFWDGSLAHDGVSVEALSTVATGTVQLFKFTPADDGTDYRYQYVQECSGRGLCDREAGVCNCFAGYTNENCDLQSALAV